MRRWRSGKIVHYWPQGSRFESSWTTTDLFPKCFSSSYKNSMSTFKSSSQVTHQSCRAQPRLFGPDPENKVTVNGLIWNLAQIMVWMILVNMQNFKLMAFLLLEIWRHKNFLSKMERVIVIRYLPPGFKQNSTKITFYAWKHLFWHKVIPPSVFPLFSSKNKNFIGSIFRDVSFQKQLQQPPW